MIPTEKQKTTLFINEIYSTLSEVLNREAKRALSFKSKKILKYFFRELVHFIFEDKDIVEKFQELDEKFPQLAISKEVQ